MHKVFFVSLQSMEKIKNLLVDMGGVLINLNRPRCIASFEEIGVSSIRELITTTYLQEGLFLKIEEGSITPEEFRDGIRKLTSQTITDQQIEDAWIAMLADMPAAKLELLLALREKYNVMLLSNTNSIHWDFICRERFSYKGHMPDDYFHQCYLSYQLGLVKPFPEIFKYVIQDAGIRPEETLLIDDARPNCETAASLGFKTYMPEAGEDWSHLFNISL